MKKQTLELIKAFTFVGIGLIGGILAGMILQQQMFIIGAVEIAEGLEGTNFEINIDVNETILVDRVTDNLNELGVFNITKNDSERGYE